ncbi:MAG: cbb3-type cytochrome oxidase assembly protein CcoS [Gammaproteobacteria bacterium]
MTILLLLVPLSLALVGLIAWFIVWAARNGQFDDLEGPAHSIVLDDDLPPPAPSRPRSDEHVGSHLS